MSKEELETLIYQTRTTAAGLAGLKFKLFTALHEIAKERPTFGVYRDETDATARALYALDFCLYGSETNGGFSLSAEWREKQRRIAHTLARNISERGLLWYGEPVGSCEE